jgi:hydroxyacylglutathione hydrolase
MKIQQFRYAADNLAYLVYEGQEAVAIDAGAVDEMLAFAEGRKLAIRCVTNTHTHADHTLGNQRLLEAAGAEFLDCRHVLHGQHLPVGGSKIVIYRTPGHMTDCVTFQVEGALITGDTLFNGTVGNCFSGDLQSFYASIRFLVRFDPATRIYAGHDYVRESMAFARSIEPDNPDIDRYLARYDPSHVVSTLADEFKVNPFLRFNDPAIIRILDQRGLPAETEYDRWVSMMDVY